jgi:hypothetical protein
MSFEKEDITKPKHESMSAHELKKGEFIISYNRKMACSDITLMIYSHRWFLYNEFRCSIVSKRRSLHIK